MKLGVILFVLFLFLSLLFSYKKIKKNINHSFLMYTLIFLLFSFMLLFTTIRFGPSSIKQLYDVYSYNINIEEGIISVIEKSSIEKGGYNIYINGEKYVLISSNISYDFKEGDYVKIEFGERSKAIIKIDKIN